MEMNDIYNDLPLYVKEAASMPMAYHQLSRRINKIEISLNRYNSLIEDK